MKKLGAAPEEGMELSFTTPQRAIGVAQRAGVRSAWPGLHATGPLKPLSCIVEPAHVIRGA